MKNALLGIRHPSIVIYQFAHLRFKIKASLN